MCCPAWRDEEDWEIRRPNRPYEQRLSVVECMFEV